MPDPTAGLGQQPDIPMYGPSQGISYGYGDQAAYQTQLRAAYGNSPLFAMGGFGGGNIGGSPGYGGGNVFSAIGSQIQPVQYTPPAFVITGYSGRYAQKTGIGADLKNLIGFGPTIRGARDYDISQNAASDLGERAGLGVGGAGLSIGEGIVGAVGGNALGLVGGFGVYMAAGKFTDQVRRAVSERREVEGFLENNSDRFFTTSARAGEVDPRRGTGMSTRTRNEVSEFMRGMDVADPMMNMQDLTQVLKRSADAGMFTGAQSVDDFKRKFKDIVENVKLVTTTLHQTLEEGVKTLKDLRSIGIDPAEAKGALMAAETMGRASGKSAGEMFNLGMQGAEMFRGTGVSMSIGFQANMMNNASIRAMRDAGQISQETIAQAGGEEALAQRMTATGLGFSQSAMGRGMAGAYFGGAGADASGFNMDAFNQFARGGQGIGQLAGAAARNLGTPEGMIRFQAHQEEFVSELGKQFGGQGLQINMLASAMPLARQLAQTTGSSVTDSLKVVLKENFNVDEQTAKTMMGSITGAQDIFDSKQRSARQTTNEQLIQEASQNFFLSRISNQIGDAWKKNVVDPVARPINNLVDSTKEAVATFNDEQMYGIRRANTAGTGQEEYTGRATAADIRKATGAERYRRRRADGTEYMEDVDLNKGSAFAASPGSNLISVGRDLDENSLFHLDINDSGNVILGRDRLGQTQRTTFASLEANTKIARVTSRTLMQAQEAEKSGALAKVLPDVTGKLTGLLTSGKSYKNLNEVSRDLFGKDVGELGKGSAEYDALLIASDASPTLRGLTDTARIQGSAFIAGSERADVEFERGALDRANAARDEIGELLLPSTLLQSAGLSSKTQLSPAAIARLADINRLRLDRTPQGAEALKQATGAFRGEMMKLTGADSDKLRAQTDPLIDRALSGDKHLAGLLSDFDTAQTQVAANQQLLGSQVLSRALESQIYGAGRDKTTVEEKQRLLGIVDSITAGGADAVIKAGKDDAKLLAKTDVGSGLIAESNRLQSMKVIGDGLGRDEIAQKLVGFGTKEQINKIADDYMAHGKSIHAAMETYHAQQMDKLAGDSQVSVAGAAGGVSTATGAPQDTMATQTNINSATLSIMLSLAQQLTKGKAP